MRAQVKPFADRNQVTVGLVGLALTAAVVTVGLQYRNLPFVHSEKGYSAYFAESGTLAAGSAVQVSGFQVGNVTSVALDGPRVLVQFKVSDDVRLGDRTEVAIKTKSLLGAKILEITPRGDGDLSGPIPQERTTPPYQLADALGDLASTIDQLNTNQLSTSLDTLSQTFADTPPELQVAVQGLGRFSQTLDNRDAQLRALLANANKVTSVLRERTDQIVDLFTQTNELLVQLRAQSDAVDSISGNLSNLSRQLSGFVADNREQFHPAVEKLNGVLTIVANRKEKLQDAIKRLNEFAMSLGESVSSGPFFNAYLGNLLPGQFTQPFIDAAFSDLGLDPNTKLPSELTDPQTGQQATPPLPPPFPRTGQGGDPRLTLPDAITGNPGDQGCGPGGPGGLPAPGPTGCYPYREPPPAPPPGGPPPGPPAVTPPEPGAITTEPTPSPVLLPAPAEGPSSQGTP